MFKKRSADGWQCPEGKTALGIFRFKLKTDVQPPLVPENSDFDDT